MTGLDPDDDRRHIVYHPARQGFLLESAETGRCTPQHRHARRFGLATARILADKVGGAVFRCLETIDQSRVLNVGAGNPYTLAETIAGHAIRRQGVTLIDDIACLPLAARNLILAMADEVRRLRADAAIGVDPLTTALRTGDLVPVHLPEPVAAPSADAASPSIFCEPVA